MGTWDHNFSFSNYVDVCISAQSIGHDTKMVELLYPHTSRCIRIVVPQITTRRGFFQKLWQNYIVLSVCLSVLLLLITKIVFNRSHRVQDWMQMFFSIIAALFGQIQQKITNKLSETIWNTVLILLIIFSTATLSAISYQSLISVKYVRQIDTLNDLMDSNLQIFVQKSLSKDIERWGSNLK